jgi:hypothetical protein
MKAMDMTSTSDLWERYFADCSPTEQAPLFASEAETLDYVRHQIEEHYPEDAADAEMIAKLLWGMLLIAKDGERLVS